MSMRVVSALATTLAFSSFAGAAQEGSRQIQKWVDDQGTVHYGDAPPPEAVKNGRSVLNDQGVVVRQVPRQLTTEEAAVARMQQEQASRRKAQDSFLLTTYTRVADIERARDDQLALIDGQITLAKANVENSDERLDSLRKRMSSFRPYSTAGNARPVPDQLAGEVVQALNERRSAQETLSKHEVRRQETSAKFAGDISRYKELTSRPSIR